RPGQSGLSFRGGDGIRGFHVTGLQPCGLPISSGVSPTRLLYGPRISLRVGLISVAIGIVIRVPLGAISAYYGGWVDLIVQRVIDVMLAFPGILLAIVLVSTLGVGLENVMIAVGIVSVPVYTR